MVAGLVLLLGGAGQAMAAPAGPAMPIAARTTPAQQMIALYRDEYALTRFRPCPPARPGEVLVCGSGRGGSSERVPLPEERGPPEVRIATGDRPTGMDALTAEDSSCRDPHCPGIAIDLIGVALSGVQVVRAIVDPEGASDHADRAKPWAH